MLCHLLLLLFYYVYAIMYLQFIVAQIDGAHSTIPGGTMREHKLSIKSASGLALGQISTEDFVAMDFGDEWLRLSAEPNTPSSGYVIETSLLGRYDPMNREILGIAAWDDTVSDIGDQDWNHYDTPSVGLRWNDVRFSLTVSTMWITAPSFERLEEALKHVAFKVFSTAV
jgi:hypothetical protein